jgi:hypothetical protein
VTRALALLLLAGALAQIGVGSANGETHLKAPVYYFGRADERLCPAPMCGGIWLSTANGASGNCSGARRDVCYVSGLDEEHARFTRLVANDGGLVWGRVAPANISGFPQLRELRVVRVWRPASTRRREGVVRLLRDNGVRCITSPCFSIAAGALNTGRVKTVSGIDLRATGASAEERRWASSLVARRGLIAAGRIVRAPDGGRTFVATQIYLPAR